MTQKTSGEDDVPPQDTDGPGSAKDIAAAYKRLGLGDSMKGIAGAKSVGIGAGDILGGLFKGQGLWTTGTPEPIASFAAHVEPLRYDIPDFGIDDSPQRTADATEAMAQRLADMHTVTEDLVRLTATNLRHTEEQRVLSARTERFTRGMTWASFVVAFASLGAAVAALLR